jgi:hypothetical protein
MLLLAYLTTRNKDWQGASIRVLAPSFDHPTEDTMADFRQKLENARINAEPEMVFNAKPSNVIGYAKGTSLVFLPFRLKGNQPVDPFDRPVEQILTDLPLTALVLAAEDIELEAEPEDGKAAEIAAAADALSDAEKRLRAAEKEAETAAAAAANAREKLQQEIETEAGETPIDGSKIDALKSELNVAEKQAEKAARRSAKAQAKAAAAAKAFEALGAPTATTEKNRSEADDSK